MLFGNEKVLKAPVVTKLDLVSRRFNFHRAQNNLTYSTYKFRNAALVGMINTF